MVVRGASEGEPNGATLRRALQRLGIPRDGVVLVHSAFRPLQRDGFGFDQVLESLLEHLATGTLLLPTMSWRYVRPSTPRFDELETPSNTGALSEQFRLRYATHRSLHPTHSVAGLGRGAGDILSAHHLDDTPCSLRSPFGKLAEYDGWVVMLAITMDCCTLVHHVEEVVAPDLYLKPVSEHESYVCRRRTGEEVVVRLRRHRLLPRDYYQFQDRLAERGKLGVANLGNCIVRAFRARDLVPCVRDLLERRPDAIIARPGQRYRMM